MLIIWRKVDSMVVYQGGYHHVAAYGCRLTDTLGLSAFAIVQQRKRTYRKYSNNDESLTF